mmetsp:Transcript_148174/g.258570  ORF Transcript_148174/g.258570 Transcript_148174/m.258570 type:complete len:481 (-) Transcript_148174:83-1525(-)
MSLAARPAMLLRSPKWASKAKVQPLSCIESDLEIVDLEEPRHVNRSPKKSPKRPAMSPMRDFQVASEFLPRVVRLKHAEADYEKLLRKREALEANLLKEESQQNQSPAADAVEKQRSRVESLRKALDLSSDGIKCASMMGLGLTTAQLCEVRQLAKHPPESARRVLIAVWLVLNSDRFINKTIGSPNDSNAWSRVCKMLADKNFIARLNRFDPATLDKVPHVLTHIARSYFGMLNSEMCDDGLPEGDMSRSASDSVLHNRSKSSLFRAANSSNGQGFQRSAGSLNNCLNSFRSAKLSTSMFSRSSNKLPLDQSEVDHASASCGALLRWLRTLVLDRARHVYLQQELAAAENGLGSAEKAYEEAAQHLVGLQADLAALRKQQLVQEETLEKLRRETPKPQHHPEFRFPKSGSPAHALSEAIGKMVDISSAWDRGIARAQPRGWHKRSAGKMTFKFRNCENAQWWQSCEVTRVPSSPASLLA